MHKKDAPMAKFLHPSLDLESDLDGKGTWKKEERRKQINRCHADILCQQKWKHLLSGVYQYSAHHYILGKDQKKSTAVIPSTYKAQPYKRLPDTIGQKRPRAQEREGVRQAPESNGHN